MGWKNRKCNNKLSNQNDQPERLEINKSKNYTKSSEQETKLLHSNDSNQQKQQNSKNRKQKWKKKRNLQGKDLGKDTNIKNDDKQNETNNQFGFGFKRLEELCDKEPSEIIFVVSNKNNGFMDLFKLNIDPDWIFLLMNVSAKICSTEFTHSKIYLLKEFTCNQFLGHLKRYILSTPMEKNSNRLNHMNFFFNNCLEVFQSFITLFPKTAVEKLKEIVMCTIIALTGIKNYHCDIEINEITMINMNKLLQNLDSIKLSEELRFEEKLVIDANLQFLPPPENFREITVYPTAIDLEIGEPFLRPNILKGAYQDVEHYLDVQFRLLREDFIASLREGIKSYRELLNVQYNQNQHKRQNKLNSIRVYNNVEFQNKGEFVNYKNSYLINFNKKKELNVDWEVTKRFMYGSLLLFTVNEFRTLFLGTVLDHNIELLKNGKLIVELLNDAIPLYNTSLTMVESEIYFEPYKCSMEVLKNISSHNFPMEKYIISACNDIDYPRYINRLPEQCYSIDDSNKFRVLLDNEWPTKEQLELDEKQYSALKAALTHEFTIIQGPPGTGKTFIGLKIMKTFIDNLYTKTDFIKPYLRKPILVVCYTNHALDQFMEGVINFTNKVVRIGGQSKSEVIENYNLRKIVYNNNENCRTNQSLKDIRYEVKCLMNKIKYYRKCSEFISENEGILEISLLKNGMPKKYHHYFNTNSDLLSWLFQDFDHFHIDPIRFITTISHNLFRQVFHFEELLKINLREENSEDYNAFYDYDYDSDSENKDIIIYSITLKDMKNVCHELISDYKYYLKNVSNWDVYFYNSIEEIKFNIRTMENIYDYFVAMVNLANANIKLPRSIKDLNLLNMRQRWALYFHWVKITNEMFDSKIMNYEKIYINIYNKYAELKELENIEVLNSMHVVALTTTGAAKHRMMLEGLQSPIVVVEEAAEVLEAHLISSLTKHCQHLILIGDHKQLRPSNAVYKLAKDFNFDISLFERMVNNNVPCYTLDEQHRMRPEIASLLTPTIYPQLKNHISVLNRKHIRGVTKNLFFLNHHVFENEVEEITSKSNKHEALFLIMFAKHLLLQGYTTSEVTILTTYSGQLFLLRSFQQKFSILKDMRIAVVDNYQGEESDIILLSLVRSNEKGYVGFLKTENRICVALSRAKDGLYIMGNMDNLYNSGNLWKQIKNTLIDQDSYGDELTLQCTIHSDIFTKVSDGEHFEKINGGGCTMLCKSLLVCGHYCASLCHPNDREHKEVKCIEPCIKSCDYNHPCLKKCFMDCGKCTVPMMKELSCGHKTLLPCFVDNSCFPCTKMVEIVLEECGHTVEKTCFEQNPKCSIMCLDQLECGHFCDRYCHKNDDPKHETYKCMKFSEHVHQECPFGHKCKKLCYQDCNSCTITINKILRCGHKENEVACGWKANRIKCNFPCERNLICNHKCQGKCHEACKPCENQVKKIIPDCGHSVMMKCKTMPKREYCTMNCERILICGHKCKNVCAVECTKMKCKEIVLQKTRKLVCGHDKVWVLCCDKDKKFQKNSQYVLDKCREPCLQKLNCNDICQGTCGECRQGRLHAPCNKKCKKINPCNHMCKSSCQQQCLPCNQKCLYSCVHSKCNNICGDKCIKCQEKCIWQCSHLECTKKCSEICNRKPCYKSCELSLQCGHNCIGFCGEPCPPLCRICQKDEVATLLFGNEDVQSARFVYLVDCGHSIESKTMEQLMNQNNEEISVKKCPSCKTPIMKTQRFMNAVKVFLEDISKIKEQQIGKLALININQKNVLSTLNQLNFKFNSIFIGDINKFCYIKHLWNKFCMPLLNLNDSKTNNSNKRHFSLSAKEVESLNFVIDLFKNMSKYKNIIENIRDNKMKTIIINHFVWLLSVAFTYAMQLSNQQKFEINIEMVRAIRIISLCKIKSDKNFKHALYVRQPFLKTVSLINNSNNSKQIINLVNDMEVSLMSHRVYSPKVDESIQDLTILIQDKIDDFSMITNEDKNMISELMTTDSFNKGIITQDHWFKCQLGHVYCVTECEGSVQRSGCPNPNCNEVTGRHV